MNVDEYKKIVHKYKPKEKRLLNAFRAFFIGGLLGLVSQIVSYLLINYYHISEMDSYGIICLIMILITCLLTSLTIFDNFINYAKCGLIIPTTGFAHSISSCTLDYKKEGFITGVGANVFKLAGSVILYGIFFAFMMCLIKVIFL